MKLFFNADYLAAAHKFETTRKSGWIADSLREHPIPDVEIVSPTAAAVGEIETVHTREYVNAVRTGEPRRLAESQGFPWDPGLWTAVTASTGGVVAAALTALLDGFAGSLSSGLHHAQRQRGVGFCTFNGLVLAADALLEHGAATVMILDLDAHCGGGTNSLIADNARIHHTDVSVSSFDSYSPGPNGTLDIVHRAGEYLDTIWNSLAEQAVTPPSVCLYNAGMDPHERCDTGGLTGITKEILAARERMVFDWCVANQVPIAFVLAGGYIDPLTHPELVELHRLTIGAAARAAQVMRFH